MYKIGDRVIVTKARAGWITGKGTWGYVTGFDETYDPDEDCWKITEIDVLAYFYKKKSEKKGRMLSDYDRFTLYLPLTHVDLYSNVISPLEDVLIKVKIMHDRQALRLQGVGNV